MLIICRYESEGTEASYNDEEDEDEEEDEKGEGEDNDVVPRESNYLANSSPCDTYSHSKSPQSQEAKGRKNQS